MKKQDKPLVWLHGEIKSPPFSSAARVEAGFLLRLLQTGQKLRLPHSRPMTEIGSDCHELRINDVKGTWRIIYMIERDCIVILEIFEKKTNRTPRRVIENCKKRIRNYEDE